MKLKHIFTLIFTVLFFSNAFAQEEDVIHPAGLRFLDYTNDLPKDLLFTKSAAFVSVLPKGGTSLRGDWKKLAQEAHKIFRQAGIDAVAYYNLEDVEAGTDASATLAQELKKREIKNIIVITQVMIRIGNKDSERYAILITPFNGENTFISHGQQAWKTVEKTSEKLLDQVYKSVAKSGLAKENHLISDVPEFFAGAKDMIRGKRFEGFAPDLKLDKLAVPKFQEIAVPDNRPGGLANKNLEKEVEKANARVPRDNRSLEAVMQEYPYEYGPVDYDPTKEDALRTAGYQYVLLRLHSTGEHIKMMLEYDIQADETDYVTLMKDGAKMTLRTIPKDAPVYKYYIKHIYSGDVYLGTPWDADEAWEHALGHYITNMKKELNVGR